MNHRSEKMSTDPKLKELRPEFRIKISRILDILTTKGFSPKISNAHRTKEQQLEKVKQGFAPATATDPGTHNWGLAGDIIDSRWGWDCTLDNAKFFAALCDACVAEGIICGGSWDRHGKHHPSSWNKYGLGYDPAHCEASKVPDEWKQEYLGVDSDNKEKLDSIQKIVSEWLANEHDDARLVLDKIISIVR
jgi:hypothetical protein